MAKKNNTGKKTSIRQNVSEDPTALRGEDVYLDFETIPIKGKPVKWAIRAKTGNYVKRVTGYLSSSIGPVSGNSIEMKNVVNWSYGNGSSAFQRAGEGVVLGSVKVEQPNGAILYLSTQKQIVVAEG